MIALGIRFLSGYAAATDLTRQRAEWPVHAGRVFMAMAAAHYETGADPQERAALEWLEIQPPPALRASGAFERTLFKTYVPVNDSCNGILNRSRQERSFPKVWLEDDTAYLRWPTTPDNPVRIALDQLCRKVTRIGHSSSLVQMWVLDPGSEPEPNWFPDDTAQQRMRVAGGGAMASFDSAFNATAVRQYIDLKQQFESAKGKAKKELKFQMEQDFPDGEPITRRPVLNRWQGYSQAQPSGAQAAVIDSPFDDELLILTKDEGCNLDLASTLQLTGALRNAAMVAAEQGGIPPPEWLTGHAPDGSPSQHVHAAFFPLPFVGSQYADAHVLGLAIALPRQFPSDAGNRLEAIRQALGALFFDPESGEEAPVKLWRNSKKSDGQDETSWEWTLVRESRLRPPVSLRPETWTKPSRYWASVTPVVLHHFPKKSRAEDVERIVREAFASALLPEPQEIVIRSVSLIEGAGHEHSLPPFTEGGKSACRYQTHVGVRFANPVRGPILVGRGRFRGYGLFRPLEYQEIDANAAPSL